MITTGYVSFDSLPQGDEPAVLAQYDPAERWNGFVCPHMDALSAVTVLDWIGSDHEYGVTYDFVPGDYEDVDEFGQYVLLVTDIQYSDPESCDYQDDYEPERIAPDADGLYALGAYAWTWTEVAA